MSASMDTFGMMLLGAAAVKYTALYLMHRKRPSSAQPVGQVSELYIYPIKSCGGVRIKQGECTPTGIKFGVFYDRHWMVINEEKNFITQRQKPSLVLIKPTLEEGAMLLSAPGMPTVTVPVPQPGTSKKIQAKCWGDLLDVLDCGEVVSQWLSKFIGEPNCKLVYLHPSFSKRDVTKGNKKLKERARPGEMVALVDFAAYHIATKPSLGDLNNRLSKEVSIGAFRANIVADGCQAFEEDKWKNVYIKDTKFVQLKLCQRCLVTTVDQEKGVKDPKEEPLDTLRNYRNVSPEIYGKAPIFGTHLSLDQPGYIQEGDTIYATH